MATSPSAIRSEAISRVRYSVSALLHGRAAPVLLMQPVPVGLPVLREQDQRRGVGRLQRQDQGQEVNVYGSKRRSRGASVFQANQTAMTTVM